MNFLYLGVPCLFYHGEVKIAKLRLYFSHSSMKGVSIFPYDTVLGMFTGSPTGSLTSESVACDIQSIKEKDQQMEFSP